MSSHVSVFVRCRPVLANELHLKRTKVECNELESTVRVQSAQHATTDRVFTFNHVMPETTTQEEVFEMVSPMIDHALSGVHATAFAYGTTGSGKTYTMEGIDYVTNDKNGSVNPDLTTPPDRHGIVPRTMEALFERVQARVDESRAAGAPLQFRVRCSFVQLYNEKLTDLITKRENLPLRWTTHGTYVVDGLSRSQCESAEQVRELFFIAVRNKVMGSHLMNQQSSRSHCIYTFYIEQWEQDAPENVVRSELSLVDLAGSEKLAQMSENPSAQLLRESIDINCSLLVLGKVITALALRSEGKLTNAQLQHVPYRESKLTKLLQHALGGNAVAAMIACITPLDAYAEETSSTLMYAGRARNIRNDPRVNEDPRALLIRQLREENGLLKAELAQYRQFVLDGNEAHLTTAQSALMSREAAASSSSSSQQQLNNNGRQQLRQGGATASSTAAGAGSPQRSTALAEKLLSSCTMLKDVVGLNGKLRLAFDNMLALKKKAEAHEAELQAENLALRERIEMLESIALRDDGDDTATSATGDDAQSADLQHAQQQRRPHHHQHGSSAALTPMQRSSEHNRRHSSPVASSIESAPVSGLPSGGFNFHVNARGGAQFTTSIFRDGDSTTVSASAAPAQQRAYSGGSGGAGQRPGGGRGGGGCASSSGQMTPVRPSMMPTSYIRAQPVQLNGTGGGGGGVGFMSGRATTSASYATANNSDHAAKKSQKQELREYAQRYRRPDWQASSSYEKFYSIAQARQKDRAPVGIDQTISELSRGLPDATASLLPASVQRTAAFGSLSFGGTEAQVSDLEERRRQRQQRLQLLQERHRLLQSGGSSAAAAFVAAGGGDAGAGAPFGASPMRPALQQGAAQGGFGAAGGGVGASLLPSSGRSGVIGASVSGALQHHQHPQLRPLQPPPASLNMFPTALQHAGAGAPGLGGALPPVLRAPPPPPRGSAGLGASYEFAATASPAPRIGGAAAATATPRSDVSFQYLNPDDLRNTFTDEQLAVLRQRAANLSPRRGDAPLAVAPRGSAMMM